MDALTQIVADINSILWGPWCLIPVLVGAGIFFTFKLRFVQIRQFGRAVKHVFGGLSFNGEKAGNHGMTSFQSLATAIAAQVGTGNLAGVATAMAMGGPGAIFWMWLAAFFGMATIFSEAILAQLYRSKDSEGHITGGPSYYITYGLGSKSLATIFSVLIIIALGFIGNMVQANSISTAFNSAFEIPTQVTGLFIILLAGFIFIGGIKRIAGFAEKMVPLMAGVYVLGAIYIMICYAGDILPTFKEIFVGAFNPSAATGGVIGASVKEAIRYGVARGLFSNEAGEGSVPNAAACATTSHPVKQGLIQAFGVFVDTLFICSASAVIVLLSGKYEIGGDVTGIALVQESLSSQLGEWCRYFMSFTITLFAFSSIIGNYYYGEVNIMYLTKNTYVMTVFRILVVAMVFFGSYASLSVVWDLADLCMALLALTNLYAIVRLGKYAFYAFDNYISLKKQGIKEPVFTASLMKDQSGVASWGNEEKYFEDKNAR